MLGVTQAAYIIPAGGVLSMILTMFVYWYLIRASSKSIKIQKDDISIILAILFMAVMGLLLLIFGEEGHFKSRNLFLWAILQLAAISSLMAISHNRYQLVRIVKVIFTLVLIEIVIILDQFLMISYGVGFSKISEHNETLAMVTGSMINPNDSAAYIGIMLLALTAFYSTNSENGKSILLLIIAFPAIFLTLSRTILAFWILNLLAVIMCTQRPIWNFVKLIILCSATLLLFNIIFNSLVIFDLGVVMRSIERILSFGEIHNDESIDFRIVSHLRLWQNFSNLGLGTFSDLNYKKFFNYGDPWLMTINPHSFLVEYSFLFGYFGLLTVLILFSILIKGVVLNEDLPISFKVISVFAILFIQAVPSSIMSMSFYIMPFLIISKIVKLNPFPRVHV